MKTDKLSLMAELEKAGAKFRGNECTCPYHDDQHPSAGVFENKMGTWVFKCQAAGCLTKGDYFDIKAKNEGKNLAQIFAESAPAPIHIPPPKVVYPTIEDAAQAISEQVQATYKYTNPNTKEIDLVIFRIMTSGGKTFRQLSPVYKGWSFQGAPKPWPLYGRPRLAAAKTIVVVEGEAKVQCLYQWGRIIACSSPGGASNAGSADWSALAGKNIILWPDNDEAGRKYMAQVQSILQHLKPAPKIKLLEPEELELGPKEDVVDLVKQYQAAGYDADKIHLELRHSLAKAKAVGIAAEVGERLEATIRGDWAAVDLPWMELSNLARPLLPGCICLLVGSVGHGKSFMLLECLAHFHNKGYRTACFELEEDRAYHLYRVLAQRADMPNLVDPAWVRANAAETMARYTEHKDFLDSFGANMWATPDTQQNLDQLAEWTAQVAADGARVIAIDPITAAAGNDKPWITDNTFLQKIKRTASDTGASIILVTHPIKQMTRPDANQLAGGAAYSRFAQSIIWLQAHELKTSRVKGLLGTADVEHNRTMIILKARNSSGGGAHLAYNFEREGLRLNELGLIVKDK